MHPARPVTPDAFTEETGSKAGNTGEFRLQARVTRMVQQAPTGSAGGRRCRDHPPSKIDDRLDAQHQHVFCVGNAARMPDELDIGADIEAAV